MVSTTASASAILAPAEIDALFTQPLLTASVAAQIARLVRIGTRDFRIPRLSADPTASWVAEGAEISPSDASLDEILVTPAKLAGLSVITQELADDSSPQAAQVVGDGLARDCARKLDQAFFGNLASPAPKGLASLTGANGATTVTAGATWTNADPFTAAVFEAANRNATVGAWVANPVDAQALAVIKQSTGSNVPLLQPDPTQPARMILNGLPLLVTTAVTAGTVWGLDPTRALIVLRDDVEIEADRSVYFTSDRVAIRARTRVGFGFPQPTSIVRIVKS